MHCRNSYVRGETVFEPGTKDLHSGALPLSHHSSLVSFNFTSLFITCTVVPYLLLFHFMSLTFLGILGNNPFLALLPSFYLYLPPISFSAHPYLVLSPSLISRLFPGLLSVRRPSFLGLISFVRFSLPILSNISPSPYPIFALPSAFIPFFLFHVSPALLPILPPTAFSSPTS